MDMADESSAYMQIRYIFIMPCTPAAVVGSIGSRQQMHLGNMYMMSTRHGPDSDVDLW